jgi:hypothetical protein
MKVYLNGDVYNGEWKDEVRQGKGIYVWVIGDRYEGEWEMGNLHGYGSYHWADSRVCFSSDFNPFVVARLAAACSLLISCRSTCYLFFFFS